ncbi:MAG: zinc-ribbon domain-containing protein [Alphaproteobacteria bacterium]|nr:zinc-ribbon domain-containing protein [Alphaproteobacteria bacterium]
MRIKCPNCGKLYEIADADMPAGGRRLRCSGCGEVFWRRPEDADDSFTNRTEEKTAAVDAPDWNEINHEKTPENDPDWNEIKYAKPDSDAQEQAEINAEQVKAEDFAVPGKEEIPAAVTPEDDAASQTSHEENNTPESEGGTPSGKAENKPDSMDDIFKRLSEQSEALAQKESARPAQEKVWGCICRNTGLLGKTNRRYFSFLLFLIFVLLMYYFRYEIVRTAPFMEKAYAALHIKSKILGEGLEFKNVSRRSYEDDYVTKMEIKGFIVNNTDKMLEIPTVKLEIMDEDARVIQSQTTPPPAKFVKENGRVAFSVTVTKPSPLSKYIYLTFAEKQK